MPAGCERPCFSLRELLTAVTPPRRQQPYPSLTRSGLPIADGCRRERPLWPAVIPRARPSHRSSAGTFANAERKPGPRRVLATVKYNHIGIPTAGPFEGEIALPHLKITVSDHLNNAFGIQWQRYWNDAPYPELVKTVAHVAFEVDDLPCALEGQQVIIEPNSPSPGVRVAFVDVNGAPVELMQIDHLVRPDL